MSVRRMIWRLALAWPLAIALSACAVPSTTSETQHSAAVPAPDPSVGDGGVPAFYTWDEAIPGTPGKLLRSEELPTGLGLVNAGEATRFLYTSRDAVDGRPIVVSSALFVPKGPPPKGGWPLIAWAHGTTGMADICSPSTYPRTARDSKYLNSWLAAGFAIVATDYQGLGTPGPHPYTNFRAHAYAVLDSVRAVTQGAASLSGKVVLLGQSQGAGTVIAAAGYAPDYAPELDISGTVATGAPNLIRSAIEAGIPSQAADFGAATAYILMAKEYEESSRPQGNIQPFTAEGRSFAELANSMCYFDLLKEVEKRGLRTDRLLQPGALAKVFSHNLDYRAYPSLRLRAPLFVGIGAADTTTTVPGAKGLVKQFCAAGTTVEAHLYAGQDHSGGVNAAFPDALAFTRKVLAENEIAPVCDPSLQEASR